MEINDELHAWNIGFDPQSSTD